jgi:agmatine deiminase
VLWLKRGELAGDDTDGHIDQLARFVNPTTIVAAWEDNPGDANHEPLRANFEQLTEMTDQDDNAFTVIRLPLPQPKFYDGHRLPACYCNFYIANDSIIVPQFDDPADAGAIKILQELCPDREVLGVASYDLVWGLGSFHCLTQQEPAC